MPGLLHSMKNNYAHSNWLEVDLTAVEANTRLTTAETQAQVMVVVKANGYGHGVIPVAKAAHRGGATWCGVGRVSEAQELRAAGMLCPILLLGYAPQKRMSVAIDAEVSLTVWSWDQILQAAEVGRELGREARLHLKIDTGMSRLGASPEDGLDMIRRLHQVDHVQLEGIFSHLAKADEVDSPTTTRQLEIFDRVLRQVESEGLRPALVHVANSAGALKIPASRFDLIRVGIAIYGMQPSEGWSLPEGYRPVLSWKSQLSQVKQVKAGTGLSYGHDYITSREERIGTVPVGYADGFRRVGGNSVLVGGRMVDVVGRVSMDQILVQLDTVPEAAVGDEVVLIGRQGEARITAEDVAARWGTVNYEVTCGIGARVPRLYMADDEVVLHEQFSLDGRRIIQPYEI